VNVAAARFMFVMAGTYPAGLFHDCCHLVMARHVPAISRCRLPLRWRARRPAMTAGRGQCQGRLVAVRPMTAKHTANVSSGSSAMRAASRLSRSPPGGIDGQITAVVSAIRRAIVHFGRLRQRHHAADISGAMARPAYFPLAFVRSAPSCVPAGGRGRPVPPRWQ
jgi:hypothetical protein